MIVSRAALRAGRMLAKSDRATTTPSQIYIPSGVCATSMEEPIIESLMIAGDAKPLVALFKKEQDRELKKKILQQIAIMGDDETAELFSDLLEEKP